MGARTVAPRGETFRKRDETLAANRPRPRDRDRRGRDCGSREGRETVVGVITDAETGQILRLGQGEDMAAADGVALQRRLGVSATGARAARDGDSTLRRMRAELSEKRRAPLCHRRRGGPMDEQRG